MSDVNNETGPPIIVLPREALVVLGGPAGAGKSTFAARHFRPTQIVSSDRLRAWISDDETDQNVSEAAFRLLYELVGLRLRRHRLTVVDSTALTVERRRELLRLGRENKTPVILILFVADRALCLERDRQRDRQVGPVVVAYHVRKLQETLTQVAQEGFAQIYQVDARTADQVQIQLERVSVDRSDLAGPFDIIGDVHGCADELAELLGRLGYAPGDTGTWAHPAGRTAIFLGDLTDRGPASVPVLQRVIPMVAAGTALYTPGNHCDKLLRALQGRKVKIANGLQQTLAEFALLPSGARAALQAATRDLIANAPPYLILDGGRLVVAHAGIKEEMIGDLSRRVRSFCLYGDVTGETDAAGHPLRRDWAQAYHGAAAIVYGHSVVPEAVWVNNTINIDTGCVFGGHLTALRWPERTLVQVPARQTAEGILNRVGSPVTLLHLSVIAFGLWAADLMKRTVQRDQRHRGEHRGHGDGRD